MTALFCDGLAGYSFRAGDVAVKPFRSPQRRLRQAIEVCAVTQPEATGNFPNPDFRGTYRSRIHGHARHRLEAVQLAQVRSPKCSAS